MSVQWMVLDPQGITYYHVTYDGHWKCSCESWIKHNDRHNWRATPGWCKHIHAINGSKVTVRQRKLGEIIRLGKGFH